MRRVELVGRLLLHRIDPSPLLHQRGQVLRDRPAARVSRHHEEDHGHLHAGQRLASACSHQFHTDIHGLVHHRGTLGGAEEESSGRDARSSNISRFF